MNTPRCARQFAHSYLAGLALVALLVTSQFSAGSASAQTKPDPNTIVSNDSTVIAPASVQVVAGKAGNTNAVQPSKGTGQLVPKAEQDIELNTKLGSATLPVSDTAGIRSQDFGHAQSLTSDGRYPVYDTTTFPNSTIVLLSVQNAGQTYRCSGFMISSNTVATAGHCLYNNGAWASNVRAWPGYSGSAAPFGSCGARSLYSVAGWTVNADTAYDYGAIKLDCEIGTSTGTLGFRWQSASFDNVFVHAQGYPVDKGFEQWGHSGKIYATETRNTFSSYTIGLAGGPIIDSDDGYAVSIFLSPIPYDGAPNGYFSMGTRITSDVFNNLLYWRSL